MVACTLLFVTSYSSFTGSEAVTLWAWGLVDQKSVEGVLAVADPGTGQDRTGEWTVMWGVQRGDIGRTFPLFRDCFRGNVEKSLKSQKEDLDLCSLNVPRGGPALEMCGSFLVAWPAGQLHTTGSGGEGCVNEMARKCTELMVELSFN